MELCVLRCQVLVVLLNFFANWIPCSSEVEKGIGWTNAIEMLYYVETAFTIGNNVVLAMDGVHAAFGHHI